MNDKKLKNMAAAGDRKAKRLEKLLSKPTRFFTAMHTGVNVSALFAAAVLMMAICERLHQKQMNTALSFWDRGGGCNTFVVLSDYRVW